MEANADPYFTTLIPAEALLRLVSRRASPVIVDAGFDLADAAAGEAAWAASRIPGSVYWHLERDLSGAKTGRNGRHPLPDRGAFARTAGAAGIAPGVSVVALDRQGGPYAARAWWLLRWLGHSRVAVLDGGLAAWTAAGGALDTGTPAAAPTAPTSPATRTATVTACPAYPPAEPLVATIDVEALGRSLGRVRLIDARAAERFRGDTEPLDPVAGHIPGALNRAFKENCDASGRFRPPAALLDAFLPLLGGRPAAEVVHQCGSGVTACHNLLAMEHAGLVGSVLYPGSWSEWCAGPERAVARG